MRLLTTVALIAGFLTAGSGAAGQLAASDGWLLLPPPRSHAAGYLTLRNPGDEDRSVISAHSPCCARIEFHRSVVSGGMASMSPVDRIEVPAHGEVVLAPRGLHLMLISPEALAAGERVELELAVDDGEVLRVELVVRSASDAPAAEPHHH